MNTLIIGGLLVIGIASLVALFFVIRGNETPRASAPTAHQEQQTNVIMPPESASDTQSVSLNGQFHELAYRLRTLQQQAAEMEQRLSSLNQLVATIERDQM